MRSRRMENGERRHFVGVFGVVLETDVARIAVAVSGAVDLLVGTICGGVMRPHSVAATASGAPPEFD